MNQITDDEVSRIGRDPDLLESFYREHAETVRAYATKLLGAPDGAWRCAGCDPEGLELQLGRAALAIRRRMHPEPNSLSSPRR